MKSTSFLVLSLGLNGLLALTILISLYNMAVSPSITNFILLVVNLLALLASAITSIITFHNWLIVKSWATNTSLIPMGYHIVLLNILTGSTYLYTGITFISDPSLFYLSMLGIIQLVFFFLLACDILSFTEEGKRIGLGINWK